MKKDKKEIVYKERREGILKFNHKRKIDINLNRSLD